MRVWRGRKKEKHTRQGERGSSGGEEGWGEVWSEGEKKVRGEERERWELGESERGRRRGGGKDK